ncbi:hypothetical protein GALMADRAFT_264719 [Galerina marginata CBS 339.88]|uniref:Uncharacterized protein n=1 Tax=Galerina marginata (strain CBS 339.88) TaxID=685588 RepID=A0A067TC74_GALM3|nr:hypothetical protein GALMADRAFT_264719 [Galerina marginata CBS 339.88]
MNIPEPEKRRVRVSSGTLPSTKISSLAACHPFCQQLDLVFPSDSRLSEALEKLETTYGRAKIKLSDILVLNDAAVFANPTGESDLLAVSANPLEEDAWCIDPRGRLTLSVSKDTYERLGLVGQKLPFKNHHERHAIDIPLQKNVESRTVRERQKTSLGLWDKRRESELGTEAAPWEMLYCWRGEPEANPFQASQLHRVQCKKKELQDVHLPVPSLSSREDLPSSSRSEPKGKSKDDEDLLDDWNRRIGSLFEWVGMACLGAQRLHVNDRVDPFVALYEPPQPSITHNITHLQWRGLLDHNFVKQVTETAISALQPPNSAIPFVSITCHALTSSPVSYIAYTATADGALQAPASVPARLPRPDGEDTWSLILERSSQDEGESEIEPIRWCLTESLGQWDARWG